MRGVCKSGGGLFAASGGRGFSPLRGGFCGPTRPGCFLAACGGGDALNFSPVRKVAKARIRGLCPLRNPPIFLMRTQRQGLVWSIDGADCGAACQKRLSLRRALWAYHSSGLEALRLIHMKCGAICALALLFHRSSSYGKTDGSTPLTGRQPKPDEQPGRDQMPEGFLIRRLDAIKLPPSPIRQRDP